jgi:hypothetical protein
MFIPTLCLGTVPVASLQQVKQAQQADVSTGVCGLCAIAQWSISFMLRLIELSHGLRRGMHDLQTESVAEFAGHQAIELGAHIGHAPGNGHATAAVGVEHPQREGFVGLAAGRADLAAGCALGAWQGDGGMRSRSGKGRCMTRRFAAVVVLGRQCEGLVLRRRQGATGRPPAV